MTQPGSIIPPTPGWWVRTERVGTADSTVTVSTSATGTRPPISLRKKMRPATPRVGPQALRKKSSPGVVFRAPKSPPIYDSTGVGLASNNGSGSWSHTLGSGASAILVGMQCLASSGVTANVDGTYSMTQIGTQILAGDQYLYVFGLLNPPVGTRTINVANTSGTIAGCSVAYRNASSFGTLQTATGNSATPTQTVTSDLSQMIFQVFGGRGNGLITVYNQTQRASIYGSGQSWPLIMGDAPGAPSVTFSSSISSAAWTAAAVTIRSS